MQLNLSYITNSHTKFVVVLDEFSPREDLLTKVRAGRCIHALPPRPCTTVKWGCAGVTAAALLSCFTSPLTSNAPC
jgi:hypothetical protein